ncbi:MAG: HAD-IC family P-type ATPase [Clostridiales bacterium]|nr:HAD-IC family P-type ATPase [Clostridiales bacterium]
MAQAKEKISGLTQNEVNQRINEGKVNTSANLRTKSVRRIFYENICTLFNAVNIVLFIALLLVGSYKNMLFMGVVLANIVIGIVQELRSKISVDRLSILSEKKVKVIRDGNILEISREDIVLDDVLVLSRGSQIPADCAVCDGECKVNESLLTGESDLITKKLNDEMLSGSFIASGKCCARVTKVGKDCYAAQNYSVAN